LSAQTPFITPFIPMDRYGHLLPVDRLGVGSRLDNLVFSNDRQVKNPKVKELSSPVVEAQVT